MLLHADRITPLGKRPIIASLSVGATRIFRVKRAGAAYEDADADTPPGRASEEAAKLCLLTVETTLEASLPGCDKGMVNSVYVPDLVGNAHRKGMVDVPCPQVDAPQGAALPTCPEAGQVSYVHLHLERNTLV